jgi:hypothetical protein
MKVCFAASETLQGVDVNVHPCSFLQSPRSLSLWLVWEQVPHLSAHSYNIACCWRLKESRLALFTTTLGPVINRKNIYMEKRCVANHSFFL